MVGSIRADAVVRADAGPFSPLYQVTVLELVPSIRAVAASNGGPSTRCGGSAKKLLDAAIADAAVRSGVRAVNESDSAFSQFAAVSAAVAPIANSPAPGDEEVVAV